MGGAKAPGLPGCPRSRLVAVLLRRSAGRPRERSERGRPVDLSKGHLTEMATAHTTRAPQARSTSGRTSYKVYLTPDEVLLFQKVALELGIPFAVAVRLAALEVADKLLRRGSVAHWIANRPDAK